jgi:phosphoribosylformylglycinamidine synthase
MKPLLLQGRPAFSPFRTAALRDALQAALPETPLRDPEVHELYLLETDSPLEGETREHVFALLAAETPFSATDGFFVTPRKGTISPWSSKATDIFHHCGLAAIPRVERGLHFRIKTEAGTVLSAADLGTALLLLHDRMTEAVYEDLSDFFAHPEPAPLRTVSLLAEGPEAFHRANTEWGLAMSPEEIDYLVAAYQKMQRDPTDAELVMFSQVNSEHCRHKIFNADWIVDGKKSDKSLFQMIRNTHAKHPKGTLVAYADNSGVLEGVKGDWWEVDPLGTQNTYRKTPTTLDILCKVETHNHPTAISPFPGAATGVGGEIRDEGATGIGGRPKAGLAAFMVSHLRLPGYTLPWEEQIAEHPARLASPLDIMIEGPIGGAAFGNEFGRPQLCGLFRTLEIVHNQRHRGYHKPIMAAGGMGNLKREHVAKHDILPKALIIQLGGPAMKIGLGGGAASSIGAGSQSEALDFDSVQRGNPEMQRRCQQVIDACIALGAANPILSIHDIGAGGLSNGLPELVEATGGKFHLRNIHNEDRSMSPMEIWCNESQERYVMGIPADRLADFESLCTRERCPFAVVGEATDDGRLVLEDSHFQNNPIDMEMSVLLGKTPKMRIEAERLSEPRAPLNLGDITLADAIDRVLRFPAVADKTFLITIADRSITGLVARDQMVGPWQTPVADVAVTASSMDARTGEAMAMGERTPVALLDAAASGRMAIGECLTNLAASNITEIGHIKLSANWMVAAGEPGEDANLFDTVKAVGMDLCPALGISIPVGKDSMSMRTAWKDSQGNDQKQVSPLSLLVTGFAPVKDIRKTLTPDLKQTESLLLLIDLGAGKNRLGASTLAQVTNQLGDAPPDLDSPKQMVGFFKAMQEMITQNLLLSYHDRSDGGLLATVAEMVFAGRKGVNLVLNEIAGGDRDSQFAALFSEELGAVVEVTPQSLPWVLKTLDDYGLSDICHPVGSTKDQKTLTIQHQDATLFEAPLTELRRAWSELTWRMQSERDNPACAKEEYDALLDESDPGLQIRLIYDPSEAPTIGTGARPRMAIFREQGINGQYEMAFAFDRAGFESVDVHMTDLLSGRVILESFAGLVACGGFSYGDVLGAGSGWAKSILYNPRLLDMFREFFARPDSFTLGVCNGCQMVSQLKDIIPGAAAWPQFRRNRSEQFEARVSNVEILPSPSLFFKDMAGSLLPIPVAHGEGRAEFASPGDLETCKTQNLISVRYINGHGQPAETYPANPNGSPCGATGFTTADGRATILMPHPERCFRSVQMSYRPADQFTAEDGPWMRMFRNARASI